MTTLKNIQLPTSWDAPTLTRLTLRDGTSYATLLADIDAALGLLNDTLTQSYPARLLSLTTEAALAYRTGGASGYEIATEFTTPDAQRAETTGHMLPLTVRDRKLGWTYLYLLNAPRYQLDADIAGLIDDTRTAFEHVVYTRLFKLEEESGPAFGLGASGVSTPFADGGAGTVAYTPPPVPNRGGTFAANHSHYLRLDGLTQANLTTAVKHLWEHGHDGPFELIVALADLATWTSKTAFPGYAPKADPLLVYGADTARARLDDAYIGGISTDYGVCRLTASGRVPTGYYAITRSYGPLDPRNPLRLRYDATFGFGARLVSSAGQFPLHEAIGMLMFGIGVGPDRTAAVLVKNAANGNYTTPAIG